MKTRYLVMLIPIGLLAGGCLPADDKDRCNGDYVWNTDTQACKLKEKKHEDAGEPDAAEEGFGEAPTGLGETCFTQDDCAEYRANICTATELSPDEGICTVEGCSIAPDNCPSGYRCCVFNNAEIVTATLKIPPEVELSSICFLKDRFQILLNFEMCELEE